MKQPIVQPVPGTKKYRLMVEYRIIVLGQLIIIPKGFMFDGASIPRYLWGLMYSPFHPYVVLAALVHDWLYFNHQCSQKWSDLIFKEILKDGPANRIKIRMMYRAVRMAGAKSYCWDRKDVLALRQMHYIMRLNHKPDQYKLPDMWRVLQDVPPK